MLVVVFFFFPIFSKCKTRWLKTAKTHCWVLFQIRRKCVAKHVSLHGSWEAQVGGSCVLNRLALIKGEVWAVSMNENGKEC